MEDRRYEMETRQMHHSAHRTKGGGEAPMQRA